MSSHYEKFLSTGVVKCIDDEIPFEIPNGWEWVRLSHLASFIHRGKSPKYSLVKKYPVVAQKCNQWSGFSIEKALFIDPQSITFYPNEHFLQDEDLLWNSTGLGTLGRMAIYHTKLNPYELAVADSHVTVIRLLKTMVVPCFLYLYFSSPTVQNAIEGKADGSTKQKELSTNTICRYLIPLPPFDEQKRIVDFYYQLLSHINKYSETQLLLDKLNADIYVQLKKSILQEAIRGKLVPQDSSEGTAKELLQEIKTEKIRLVKEGKLKKQALVDSTIYKGDDNRYWEKLSNGTVKCIDNEIPFKIPNSWEWARIIDVVQINPKNAIINDDTESAFIPMEKIGAGYGSKYTYDKVMWGTIKHNFVHFATGDVAFAKITPCFQNRKSVIFGELPNDIGAGTSELKVIRTYGETINRLFILYFLKSPYFIEEAIFKGTANQQRIISGYLENKLLPIPPLNEQQRIVSQVEKLFEKLQ